MSPEAELQTFRRFLDKTVQDALRPGAIGLSLLYIVFTFGHYFWLPPKTAHPLMIAAAGTAVALAALYVALGRRSVAAAWSHAVAAGIASLVL